MSVQGISPADTPLELSVIPCLLMISPGLLSQNLRNIVTATSPKNITDASPAIKINVGFPNNKCLLFGGFIKNQSPSPTKTSERKKVSVIFVLLNGISICSSFVILFRCLDVLVFRCRFYNDCQRVAI